MTNGTLSCHKINSCLKSLITWKITNPRHPSLLRSSRITPVISPVIPPVIPHCSDHLLPLQSPSTSSPNLLPNRTQ
ncbi:hypothetical protein SLEP1_g56111 [Rubroshorea leprosula]|uniref:Uncharacterized protein n=1 Tax=Rubroshorea leprosula TaxID=152421 RepID=A0AAV5MHD7_9ROSI|nr:hypothetical protein SLEP1_g56111 [Rubroshorea leprosula]